MALFPFVPNVPGVPALLRDVLRPIEEIELLVSDTLSFLFGGGYGAEWGVFLNGEQVIFPDAVIALEYRERWSIADSPIEEGGFENYNKVQTPYSVKMRLAAGGDVTDRSDFLESISAVMGDLNLYDVITPEKIYTSVNFEQQDYRRTAVSGNGLVSVDVWFQQINIVAEGAFSDTKTPSGSGQVNAGTVQPTVISQALPNIPGTSVAPTFPRIQ